jgi:CheY-like chemotaxis protein
MASREPAQESAPPATPRVILAVDDDEAVRRVAAENLRRLGFTVIEARDGDEALRILGDTSRRIDLLFSDVRMPGPLSGPALAEMAVRSQPSLRVLLTSGNPSHADVSSGPGRFRILNKPYRRADLAAAIAAALAP